MLLNVLHLSSELDEEKVVCMLQSITSPRKSAQPIPGAFYSFGASQQLIYVSALLYGLFLYIKVI